mmetsp:Transcript_139309/g.445421  ORF Transcript_139309/g.445421 Transcript_139309/m.445421 type:complete len:244 (-) Transcript_139309:80-811(-)
MNRKVDEGILGVQPHGVQVGRAISDVLLVQQLDAHARDVGQPAIFDLHPGELRSCFQLRQPIVHQPRRALPASKVRVRRFPGQLQDMHRWIQHPAGDFLWPDQRLRHGRELGQASPLAGKLLAKLLEDLADRRLVQRREAPEALHAVHELCEVLSPIAALPAGGSWLQAQYALRYEPLLHRHEVVCLPNLGLQSDAEGVGSVALLQDILHHFVVKVAFMPFQTQLGPQLLAELHRLPRCAETK